MRAGAPILVNLDEPGVYAGLLQYSHFVAQTIVNMPLEAMLDAIRLAETHGPLVDPTLFIKNGKAMQQDKEILTALRSAQSKLKDVAARASADAA